MSHVYTFDDLLGRLSSLVYPPPPLPQGTALEEGVGKLDVCYMEEFGGL